MGGGGPGLIGNFPQIFSFKNSDASPMTSNSYLPCDMAERDFTVGEQPRGEDIFSLGTSGKDLHFKFNMFGTRFLRAYNLVMMGSISTDIHVLLFCMLSNHIFHILL